MPIDGFDIISESYACTKMIAILNGCRGFTLGLIKMKRVGMGLVKMGGMGLILDCLALVVMNELTLICSLCSQHSYASPSYITNNKD